MTIENYIQRYWFGSPLETKKQNSTFPAQAVLSGTDFELKTFQSGIDYAELKTLQLRTDYELKTLQFGTGYEVKPLQFGTDYKLEISMLC